MANNVNQNIMKRMIQLRQSRQFQIILSENNKESYVVQLLVCTYVFSNCHLLDRY